MMTLDPIPQAITEVVSCECKTNCCIGGAKRESNTICNTADVSEIWKWFNH